MRLHKRIGLCAPATLQSCIVQRCGFFRVEACRWRTAPIRVALDVRNGPQSLLKGPRAH
ncbi:hypothetical protein BDV93DRAFT_289251 [Ceratobasidium sp. AG-I]|nr:hypothetical protein BDV93DRAFT_289251 [Ceratobasidium sp. AG-I]